MMSEADNIPDGELFADLQQSMTDLYLMKLLMEKHLNSDNTSYNERYNQEEKIQETIRTIIADRFSKEDIIRFLEKGYPRQINLSKIIKGGN